jgi:antibiotic biosynthesis monooxygenase (ABM) superfamily enzyme
MKSRLRTILAFTAILVIFAAGYAAGANRFGMPKTILHVVIIRWKPGTTAAERQKVIDGVREMAASIPGIRNIWIKPARMASLKWNAAFVIEFANRAAAARYADAPSHKAWAKLEEAVRADSLNVQVTN